MAKNRRLKGFTILEALLSLLILSIIISLTYLMFNLFNRQMLLFEKENSQVLQYNLFNKTIKYDVNAANGFDMEDNTLVLKKYDEGEVAYSFEKRLILRTQNETVDTFKLQVAKYKYFGGEEQEMSKRLEVSLKLLEETIEAHYFLTQNEAERINKRYFNED